MLAAQKKNGPEKILQTGDLHMGTKTDSVSSVHVINSTQTYTQLHTVCDKHNFL